MPYPLATPHLALLTKHPPGAVNDSLHQPTNARRFLREAPITWEAQVVLITGPMLPLNRSTCPKNPALPARRPQQSHRAQCRRVQGRRAPLPGALWLAALFSVLLPGACRREASDRPEDTLRTFLARLREGRPQEAWSQLSTTSQTALRERARLQAERRSSLTRTRAQTEAEAETQTGTETPRPVDASPPPAARDGASDAGAPTPSQAASAAPEDPSMLLFSDLRLIVLGEPENIVLVSPFGQEVTLRVSLAQGRSADFRLVREGKAWKVDLMSALMPVSKT
ncbi:MAG: hypothetical protein H6729_12050 [Deltaproteobacteria bacterium]|nr:hypothetical protein [Deltaproteobacteria bacterium]